MSAPKKGGKKAPAKKAPEHAIKDERRAHEHLARVECLHKHVGKPAEKDITKLTDLAHQELQAGHAKHAVDLLRAAEHLSFASLHGPKGKEVHPKLAEEFENEFESKMGKAEEHWSEDDAHLQGLDKIYADVKERAQKALDDSHHQAALELARAAEAISHVQEQAANKKGDSDHEEVESEEEENDSEEKK